MRIVLERAAAGIVALLVSVGFLVGTADLAAASGCRTSFATYSTVGAGTSGSKARAVECLLQRAGFATTQNSSFSTSDAGKLRQLQRRHAMKPTGRTNAATWAALLAQGSTPSLARGDSGASVRRLQLTLRALGHDELSATSYYGARTEAAVKSLQGKVGLERTGRTSRAVWAVLQNGGRKVPAPSSARSSEARSSSARSSSGSSRGARALAYARAQLGDPYRFGAAGPSRWDCSGLTMKAWAAAGKRLPHSSTAQYRSGTRVSKANLRPGDLVFFYSGPSHVAIYAGGGRVIHAPRPGKRVEYIQMKYMPFKGARRPA